MPYAVLHYLNSEVYIRLLFFIRILLMELLASLNPFLSDSFKLTLYIDNVELLKCRAVSRMSCNT